MIFRSARVVVRGTFVVAIATSVGMFVACSGGSSDDSAEPSCLLTAGPINCTPEYDPTYANVFKYTLSKTCGAPGCHSAPNPKAGLELDNVDTARTNLLATNAAGERRVIPGDVKCGKVIVRLETVGEPWSMPPNGHRGDEELCSIRQWIADGANP